MAPTVPPGKEVVVTTSGALTVIEKLDMAPWWGDSLSTTDAEKTYVPPVVGVPLIAPDAESARPGGNAPDSSEKVYGVCPPAAIRAVEYGMPTAPEGRLCIPMERGA